MRADRAAADPLEAVTAALVRACRALAAAGRADEAARAAADAWVVLREPRPALATKLDGAMHWIARMEQQQERHAAGVTTTAGFPGSAPDMTEEGTA